MATRNLFFTRLKKKAISISTYKEMLNSEHVYNPFQKTKVQNQKNYGILKIYSYLIQHKQQFYLVYFFFFSFSLLFIVLFTSIRSCGERGRPCVIFLHSLPALQRYRCLCGNECFALVWGNLTYYLLILTFEIFL
jgi:hypothetical protein